HGGLIEQGNDHPGVILLHTGHRGCRRIKVHEAILSERFEEDRKMAGNKATTSPQQVFLTLEEDSQTQRNTMSDAFIPPAKPIIGDEEREAVDRVLRSGMIAQGPEVATFEEEFAT